jgi:hypothetical protein
MTVRAGMLDGDGRMMAKLGSGLKWLSLHR